MRHFNPLTDSHLGYYSCDGINFIVKNQAYIHATKTGKPVAWHFHDEVYSKFPWYIEPDIGLEQLYDMRARELREKYDYLIVMYSGGADSHNIVKCFQRQGLLIDEIITMNAHEGNKNFKIIDPTVTDAWNLDAEYDLQALPRLNELRNEMPGTKFTILDTTANSIDRFDSLDEEWVTDARGCLSLAYRERFNIYHFKSIRENFDKGKSVGIVDGIDKPIVNVYDNRVFISFADAVCNGSIVAEQNFIYSNVRAEYFYWAETTAPLIAKQAHIVKRWLENNPSMLPFWDGHVSTMEQKWANLDMTNALLRDIIYTTWDTSWYQVSKGRNGFAGSWVNKEFDMWAKKLVYGTKNYQIWQRGLQYVIDNAGNYVRLVDNKKDALQIIRKEFYVGKLDTKLNTA
jgi:hypothetical protein